MTNLKKQAINDFIKQIKNSEAINNLAFRSLLLDFIKNEQQNLSDYDQEVQCIIKKTIDSENKVIEDLTIRGAILGSMVGLFIGGLNIAVKSKSDYIALSILGICGFRVGHFLAKKFIKESEDLLVKYDIEECLGLNDHVIDQ